MLHPNEPLLNELYTIQKLLYTSNEKDVLKKIEAIEVQIKRHRQHIFGLGQSN